MDKCKINKELCKGCQLCVEFCPRKCLEMSKELNPMGYHPSKLKEPKDCTACAMCAEMCPEMAITIFRAKKKKKK